MPAVNIIDLRHEKRFQGGLSETLRRRCTGHSTRRDRLFSS